MRNPETVQMLERDVIRFFQEYGVGYTKIDYNENIGIGCDGAESLGEGLRQHGLAAQEFIKEIKRQNPDLVLEICASGGMRAEPSMIALGSQMSFSDIHETEEGAVIAANMHRVLQPSRSQIWATLRKSDDERRLVNTISKAFLGRLCFSGDIAELDQKQSDIVKQAVALYRRCVPTIKDGFTYFLTPPQKSLRHLRGKQVVLRCGADGDTAYLTLHTFEKACEKGFSIQNEKLKGYTVIDRFIESGATATLTDGVLKVTGMGRFSGAVLLLRRQA
jgi:alpha-galactosidase